MRLCCANMQSGADYIDIPQQDGVQHPERQGADPARRSALQDFRQLAPRHAQRRPHDPHQHKLARCQHVFQRGRRALPPDHRHPCLALAGSSMPSPRCITSLGFSKTCSDLDVHASNARARSLPPQVKDGETKTLRFTQEYDYARADALEQVRGPPCILHPAFAAPACLRPRPFFSPATSN